MSYEQFGDFGAVQPLNEAPSIRLGPDRSSFSDDIDNNGGKEKIQCMLESEKLEDLVEKAGSSQKVVS